MSSEHLAHAEDGAVIESTDFPFDEICQREEAQLAEFLTPDSDLAKLTPEQIAIGVQVFTTLLKWIWQSGMKNPNGVKIRAIICCWIFLKELRPVSETDMAVGYGLKKQSLGRWVEQFKKAFPNIRISQLR